MELKFSLPKEIDAPITSIISYLGLDAGKTKILKYTSDDSFEAEAGFCHINVWVKYLKAQGMPVFGWMLAQNKTLNITQAQFHCVWKSPSGELIDITPRPDSAERVMFIPDPNRQVLLTGHEGQPALISFDNVRMLGNHFLTKAEKIKIIPETDMFTKYGLIVSK